jgi:hypothetical protein
MSIIILVYGFENEWKIFDKKDAILCKSFKKNHIVYACPFIIEDQNIYHIIEKKKYFEKNHQDLINQINTLAERRGTKACWKLAFYSIDQIFKGIGYESDGDENGDGR